MPTVNGWNIIPMPAFPPVPQSIEWGAIDVVGANLNPFTLQEQTYDWGAAKLEASLTYQSMTNAQAIAMVTFLMALRGRLNVLQFGDPLNKGPQNSGATAPSVSGSGQTGFLLNINGGNGLSVGDWIQIGYRLYKLLSVAPNQLGIYPNLRECPADGAPILITNTQGLWRLKNNERKWSVSKVKMYGVTFEIEEAL